MKQNGAGSNGTNKNKRSMAMAPPNIPLPPTPQTQFASPPGHPMPVSLNGTSLYSSGNDIYEHLPGEHHHMYDLTYEDTQSSRKQQRMMQDQAMATNDGRPGSVSPPPGVTVNGITVNGFVMGS